jgi:hypothetical protein
MLERDIEAYLVKRCKQNGVMCEKFTSPQRRAVPDRLLTFGPRMPLLELKATGAKPTEAQVRDHDRRRLHGVEIAWTDSIGGVDSVIHALLTGGPIPLDKNFRVIPFEIAYGD